jgi:hypothetical protein
MKIFLLVLFLFLSGCASKPKVKNLEIPSFPKVAAPTFPVDETVVVDLGAHIGTHEVQKEILERIQFVEALGYETILLCELWDYLAIPKESPFLEEIKNTKIYRDHLKHLKRWVSL